VEEMKTKRLHVSGDFPEFVVTNKSGTGYKVRLDPHGSGTCTCPDFQVRIAQEGRICKHIAASAIIALAPQVQLPSAGNGNGFVKPNGSQTGEVYPLVFRIRRNVQTDGKNGVQVEVQARVTNDEVQDRETASYAYDLLERLASLAAKGTASSESNFARETASPSAAVAKCGTLARRRFDACHRSYWACIPIHSSGLVPSASESRKAISADIPALPLRMRDRAARVTPKCWAASVTDTPPR